MTTMLSTLGVIVCLLLISLALYFLYFRNRKSEKKFNFNVKELIKQKDTQINTDSTYLPPLFSFVVESTGQVFEVKSIPNNGLTVGRASPSDIIITTKGPNSFSAEHFVICTDENGVYVNVIPAAHQKNGIRLEPELNAPKIASSIDITHKLKLYIGVDSVTFYLPNGDDATNPSKTITNDRCTRR